MKRKNFSRKIKNRVIIIFVCLVALLTVFFAISKLSNVHKNIQNGRISTKEQYQNAEITLGCTGDILIHSPILDSCCEDQKDYNFDDIFTCLKPYISDLDYSVANVV